MDATPYFRAGLSGLRRHAGLVLGLYAFALAMAVAIVFPLHLAFERATASALLPLDLRGVTLSEWWALLQATSGNLGLTLLLAFALVPLHGAVRSVLLAGAAAALRPADLHGFWTGVGRYGLRGLGLAVVFALLAALAFGAVSLASVLLGVFFSGERGVFWTQFVVVPTLLVAVLAVLDLMHDYARAALVVEDLPVGKAIRRGAQFPFKNGVASRLYVIWFALTLGLWLLPFAFDAGLRAASFAGVAVLFALQQTVLFLRAAATVGWVGSSVRLYSDALDRERVWIAEVDDATASAYDPDVPLA